MNETNLPRSVWIGGGIVLVLGLLLCCTAAGVGIGFTLGARHEAARRAALPVAVANPMPDPVPAEVKPDVKPGASIDRAKLIGKWESFSTTKSRFALIKEFKADGSYGIGNWSLDGDICTLDLVGRRHQFQMKFENDKLIVTPINPTRYDMVYGPFGDSPRVLMRVSKEREDELR